MTNQNGKPPASVGALKGVQYLFDKQGRPAAVLIDLRRNAALWEDIVDILEARKREAETAVPLEKVKERLRRKGKIS